MFYPWACYWLDNPAYEHKEGIHFLTLQTTAQNCQKNNRDLVYIIIIDSYSKCVQWKRNLLALADFTEFTFTVLIFYVETTTL